MRKVKIYYSTQVVYSHEKIMNKNKQIKNSEPNIIINSFRGAGKKFTENFTNSILLFIFMMVVE